jgi:hypothetical protein
MREIDSIGLSRICHPAMRTIDSSRLDRRVQVHRESVRLERSATSVAWTTLNFHVFLNCKILVLNKFNIFIGGRIIIQRISLCNGKQTILTKARELERIALLAIAPRELSNRLKRGWLEYQRN